jgi:hypothetical protein
VSKPPVPALIDCVYGSAQKSYSPEDVSAARRLLARPGFTLAKASLLMAIVSSSRFWEPVIVSVEKLELHLDKLLDLLAKDPSAPGNRAAEAGYQPYQDPAGEAPREQAKQTNEQKREAALAPWRELVAEAHARGLTGLAMSRWVFAERERRTGVKGIAVAANKILDAIVSKAGRPDFGDLFGAPKTETEDVRNPRHFAEEGEGE